MAKRRTADANQWTTPTVTSDDFSAVALALTNAPQSIKSLSDATGRPTLQVSMILTEYALAGFVAEGPSGQFRVN